MFKVKEVMSFPPVTVEVNTSIKYAAKVMIEKNVSSVIVVKEDKPIGIVSKTDLIKRVLVEGVSSEEKINKIMSKPLITISEEESVLEASRKMRKANVKRLPVLDKEGKLVGVISVTDIAALSPEMVSLLEHRMRSEERRTISGELAVGECEACGNFSEALVNVNDQWVCEACKDELERLKSL